MKTFTFLLVASLLVINNLFAQAPEESPELKQATTLTEEALKLFKDGKYDDALSRARRALEIREKLLPQTDPRIATSLSYVGDIYLVKKNYKSARPLFERLLQMQTEQFGPEHVNLANTLDRLAVLYAREGSAVKADEMYKRGLTLREKAFGPDDLRVAQSEYALAQFYRGEQDFDRSADHYKRALLIYGRASGLKNPEFERASDGLTCLYYESGKRQLIEDLNKIRQQFVPPNEALGKVQRHILDGKALKLPKPKYPMAARERRLSGIVVVKVEIDEEGKVINATDMCQGPPYLTESALESAREALFEPMQINGQPAKFKGVLRYKFVVP